MKPIRWAGMLVFAALLVSAVTAQTAWGAWANSDADVSQYMAPDPDSCTDMAWRSTAFSKRWYNLAGPSSTGVPIFSFRLDNGDATPDTLFQMWVHSICERTNTIGTIRLYREQGSSTDAGSYFNAGDVLLQTVTVTTPFQTNDSVLISGLTEVIPGDTTRWYHLVVDMNTAGIGNNTTYDGTGVMVNIRPERIALGGTANPGNGNLVWGPNPGDTLRLACVPTSPANNAYSIIIDNQAPSCADLSLLNIFNLCDSVGGTNCDGADLVLSLGDSLLIDLTLDINNIAMDTCVAGWPKIFVREFTSNASAVAMGRYKGWSNYDHFCYVAEFDSTNGDGPYDLMNIPTTTVNNPVDVNANFYYLVAELKDAQNNIGRCSLLVPYKIDTDKPVVAGRPSSFTLHYDANGNGIVNPGDTIRFFIDMTNEPFGEICTVYSTLYGWYGSPYAFSMVDDAGDRRFEFKHEVAEGILDAAAGTQSVWLHVFDNGCNQDSIQVTLPNAVDNQPLNTAAWLREFLRLSDTDQNGCLKIGESVRIRVENATDADLDSIYANVLQAGLGDLNNVFYSMYPLSDLGSGVWQLDWILGDQPQDSAIDYAANDPAAVVYLYAKDDAGNWDTVATSFLEQANAGYNIDTEYPLPVENLSCRSLADGIIELDWDYTDPAADVDFYRIYWDNGTGTISYTTPLAEVSGGVAPPWSTDGTVVLVDGTIYRFEVWTVDDCGNVEQEHPTPVACVADATPPTMCVFQPEPGGLYCDDFEIYTCPLTPASNDVVGVTVYIRLQNDGTGNPGPWTAWTGAGQNDAEVCFTLGLGGFDGLVGPDTSKVIEVAVVGTDEAGNTGTPDEAWAACDEFWFTWSTHELDGEILTINGAEPLYQAYCNEVGFPIWGATNEVCFHVEGGIPPYKVRAWADDDEDVEPWNDHFFYTEEGTEDMCINLDATNWDKGLGRLRVRWTDACGAETEEEVWLCVPDSVAPCARITNPVDGKCIRRSRSMLDPVEDICVTIDPLENCIDPDDVLKVDFQWSEFCCPEGQILGYEYFLRESTYVEGGTSADSCDTTYFNELDGDPPSLWGVIKRIHCYFSEQGEEITVFIPDSAAIVCEDSTTWHTFAIVPGPRQENFSAGVQESGEVFCTDWWNTEDLAWITESGTNIFLRAIVYDDQGNFYTTECVQVCVDIDTPPLCIWSPDICVGSDGVEKISGSITIVADLDLAVDNIDDIEDVTLWYKRSMDPDREEFWNSLGSGFFGNGEFAGYGTRNSVWRWDNIDTENDLEGGVEQEFVDFRVIAQTLWGTYSYDLDGNGDFDANTFDSSACDMATWFVDNTAPSIAMDTLWTLVDGEEVVQPNVSCRLSDPRGWAWIQYGQTFTIQPSIYPFADMSDVKKVTWTVYDDECAECGCEGSNSFFSGDDEEGCSKVVAIRQDAEALNPVTIDLSVVPFVQVENGAQTVVLTVEVEDYCGNTFTDCITLYILDVEPTHAIILDPMDSEVFCQDHDDETGGGIEVTAFSLNSDEIEKAVFYYRAAGSETWIPFDSTNVGGNNYASVIWYPHALGLTDGAYELNVVAVDYSLNRQAWEDTYPITVYFSCGLPTVELTVPEPFDVSLGNFLGCDLELTAVATSPDPNNPVVEVCFYYQYVTSDNVYTIGCDYHSTGSTYNYHWDPKDDLNDGSYYIWAQAWTKGGTTAMSEKVWVKMDYTSPWTEVIEVNGDGSDGGSGDPTRIVSGSDVDIYAFARDNQSENGYGEADNCGIDSMYVYIYDDEDVVVFGELMAVDPNIDSLYMVTWPTAGLPNGTYYIYSKATDCACNYSWSNSWYVEIVNPLITGTIAVDEAVFYCDYFNVVDDSININLTPEENADISSVVIWMSPAGSSDVYDQYFRPSPNNGTLTYVSQNGRWEPIVNFGTAGLSEGLYRVRAVVTSSSGQKSEDFDGDGLFDDFTFDPATYPNHMWLRIDRSVTPFEVALNPGMTIKSGRDLTVTVTPEEECDIETVCYGVVAENGVYGEHGCDGLTYVFDPVDSGLVSLLNGIWSGSLRTTVWDPLGNSGYEDTDLWILDMDSNQVRITWPLHGDYVSGVGDTLVAVTARKLSKAVAPAGIDSVRFFYAATATGAGTYFGKATPSGDEFNVNWNIKNVSEGDKYIWGEAYRGSTKIDNAPKKVWIIITKTPTNIVLKTPVPNYTRTVGPDVLTFVGGRVDLCLDKDSLSSVVSGVGIDSVVWCYRLGETPGAPNAPDPNLGWTYIGSDRYGSLCTDWFTQGLPDEQYCYDGRYALAAWVYDKAGNVNHSNIVHVMVDNTDPYTEIVDIDGDETFGDCHEIVLTGNDTQVKFTAVAIDDRSCAGDERQYNSGAKYLQFFVGNCEGLGGGCVDIVWVVDASGSMGDDQEQIAAQAANLFVGLGGVDFRMGVMAYTDISNPIALDGSYKQGGAGTGEFTTDLATFQTMITSVGDQGSGTENGLTGMQDALAWYPFRGECSKVLILVTDEDADDISNFASIVPGLIGSDAQINTVINFGDSTGYSIIAPTTGGAQLDITSSWGANLAALASQISGGLGSGGDVGIIWGKQVTLNDGDDDAFAYWDPTGLPTGTYCAWTVVTDQIGNTYTSNFRQVCIEDRTPPVGYIAGFGVWTDEHMNRGYRIYGQSWDTDIDHVQFQYRVAGSTSETDWTGIGVAGRVNSDSLCWVTQWNPCLLTGQYDLRMVPTDKAGNEDFAIQPIVRVQITNTTVQGKCVSSVQPVTANLAAATIGFQDERFNNLGLVDVTTTDEAHNSMLAVYSDLLGGLQVEKVALNEVTWGDGTELQGNFDDSQIFNGGEGNFWLAYNIGLKTYLRNATMHVYRVPGNTHFRVTDANLGATVDFEAEALPAENGLVMFPARLPRVALMQPHIQVWTPDGNATALRLTSPLEYGFNEGTYAEIEISYTSELPSDQLTVAWWDEDHWNTTDGLFAGPAIENGKAKFFTNNLHGIYAVVSAGRECTSGALTVSVDQFSPSYNGYVGNWPVIYGTVKSNIEGQNGNGDIDWYSISVLLDGVTIHSNGQSARGWDVDWDNISGQLFTRFVAYGYYDSEDDEYYYGYYDDEGNFYEDTEVLPLTSGDHTISVQAFTKAGYCNSDEFTFSVDVSEPDVYVVEGYVCPNPCFWFKVNDQGSGVNWDSVYADVYDMTISAPHELSPERLLHTETPDAWERDGDSVFFCLTKAISEGHRLRLVIYNGKRSLLYNEECGCVRYVYNYDSDGVPDMVGNHTEIVEENYVVSSTACHGGTDAGKDPEVAEGNPFDPYKGESVTINLNGFATGGGSVSAIVYDLTGEKVRSLGVDVGTGLVQWDGTNEDGDIVAQAVYLLHVQRTGGAASGPRSKALKIVLQRAE
ncbi:MAG: hypothetical protein AB1752_00735 [Candidatus Zixiibacteriota bacterium]